MPETNKKPPESLFLVILAVLALAIGGFYGCHFVLDSIYPARKNLRDAPAAPYDSERDPFGRPPY